MQRNNKYFLAVLTIIISALLYFYSLGFHDIGILVWFAPIPVLLFGLRFEPRLTFVVAFITSLLGSSDILQYSKTVIPMMPLIFSVICGAIFFAINILLSCWVIKRLNNWVSIFIFPSLWVTFEFLSASSPTSGTYGSIAYSQVHLLKIIQITSLTGIWGLSFLICLIPSAIVVAYYLRKNKKDLCLSLIIPAILLIGTLIFGITQLNKPYPEKTLRIAAISFPTSIDEMHSTDPKVADEVIRKYLNEFHILSTRNIDLIIFPEKILRLTSANQNHIKALLKQSAKDHDMAIVAGFSDFSGNDKKNIAIAYAKDGSPIDTYQKEHLLPGPESIFTPGNNIVTFKLDDVPAGIAICKDMDFKNPAAEYGKLGTGILFVPALDFVIDEWMHANIAIMQGVMNGYVVARAAQWGLLSVSDDHGRIVSEISTAPDSPSMIIAEINPGNGKTFYAENGDWFAYLSILLACLAIAVSLIKSFVKK